MQTCHMTTLNIFSPLFCVWTISEPVYGWCSSPWRQSTSGNCGHHDRERTENPDTCGRTRHSYEAVNIYCKTSLNVSHV